MHESTREEYLHEAVIEARHSLRFAMPGDGGKFQKWDRSSYPQDGRFGLVRQTVSCALRHFISVPFAYLEALRRQRASSHNEK